MNEAFIDPRFCDCEGGLEFCEQHIDQVQKREIVGERLPKKASETAASRFVPTGANWLPISYFDHNIAIVMFL